MNSNKPKYPKTDHSDSSGISRRDFLRLGGMSLALTSLSFGKTIVSFAPLRTDGTVVVIGAGISGIAAARRLVDEFGFDQPGQVIVLEARDRIGGRINTDHSLGYPMDMGASWIDGSNGNPISTIAEDNGIQLVNTNWDSIRYFAPNGQELPRQQVAQMYMKFDQNINKIFQFKSGLTEDQPLADTYAAINANGNLSPLQQLMLQWHYFWEVNVDLTLHAGQLSTLSFWEDSEFPGLDRVFPGGYDQITNILSNGLDIRTNHIVSQIDYTGEGVAVTTNQGSFQADYCVVTLPLGVLKANSVSFLPGLPSNIQNSVDKIGFGKAFKMVLEFPEVFWDENLEFIGKLGTQFDDYGNGEHIPFINMKYYADQPALIFMVAQDFAEDLEGMSDSAAINRVMQDLKRIYGTGIPNPTNMIRTDFIGSPYSGGSYSYWAVDSRLQDTAAFGLPVSNKLFFAGEHTSFLYPATVHGAHISGQTAAQRVFDAATSVPVAAAEINSADLQAASFELEQNYPNPFNPSTSIGFNIPDEQDVTLTIYDMSGRKVKTLVSRRLQAGKHLFNWDGTNAAGNRVSSGVYVYRLKAANGFTESRQMMLAR